MNKTQQKKLEVALEFLDIGKGISCQKGEQLSSWLGWVGVPPKRKTTRSRASLREVINECGISSNSPTLWPHLAPTLERWGGEGWVKWQWDKEDENAHLTPSSQTTAALIGGRGLILFQIKFRVLIMTWNQTFLVNELRLSLWLTLTVKCSITY